MVRTVMFSTMLHHQPLPLPWSARDSGISVHTHHTETPDGRQMGATDRWDFGHVLMCMTRPVMFRCPFPHSPTPYISFCPQYSRWACCKVQMCGSALPTSFPSSLENRQSHTLSRHYTMVWCAHLCCVTTSDRLRCIHRAEVGGREGRREPNAASHCHLAASKQTSFC